MVQSNSRADRHKRGFRPQCRLVLPTATADNRNNDVLKSLVETWLVPRLVEEFIREHVPDLTRSATQASGKSVDESVRAVA
jgi:hypothetical protein